MTKPCAFCAVVRKEASAHVVLEDDVCVGFLDLRPLFRGHVLIVPRAHVATLPELAAAEVGPLFARVRQLTRVMPAALSAEGTFVAMNNAVSQSVPHLHVHVVPRTKGDGLKGFFWPRTKYASEAEMAEVAGKLGAALAADRG
jgi:histidine triad (HIT) family protein